jgi:hypothetical protein
MRLCWNDMVGFRALYKVFALSVVLTLTLASAAFAAPGTVDVSANLPNSPNSDSWTLTKTFYSSNSSCTGAGTTTTSTLTGTAINSTATANGTSVRLQASAASGGGQRSFSQWTSPSDHTFTTINSTTICVTGQNNVTKSYLANYVPKLGIGDVTVTEGDSGTTNATFTVSLSATSSQSVTVNFATANGTATQPGDYTSNSGTLTFASGETTKSVTVVAKGDTVTEADETFFVNLSSVTNATIVDNQGVGTITNDDYTPQANDDGSVLSPITLTEDDPNGVTTNVLSNDTGLGDTPVTVQVTTPPGKGTTTVNPDKTITYEPNANQNGPDTYSYAVTDSDGQTSTATVYLQITAVNDAPTISDIPDQGTEEDTETSDIGFTVGDVETLAALLTVTGSSSNTALVPDDNITFGGLGANRTVRVTPTPDESGTATITVNVSDGAATTSDTFVLTVNATNDAPNAVDDTATADEGGPDVTISVLANDGDVDEDTLTITNNTQPPAGEGSVTCSNTNCTFTPDANFNGTTGFDYTISDGNGGADTATVTVNVAATDDAPVAGNDSYVLDEDGTLNVGAPGVLENDTDVDDLLGPVTALTAAVVNGPNNGTLTLNGNGSFTYAPSANYNGSDSFAYEVCDDALVPLCDEGTVTINVSAVNDAPSFDLPANPNQTVDEDAGAQTVSGFATNVLAGAADESAQVVSFAVTNDNNALFSNQPAISPSGALNYTSTPDASGTAEVTVRTTDDGGTTNGGEDESALQSFTITVNAVNDTPAITLSGPSAANEGQTKTYAFTVIDPDSSGFTPENGFPDCGDGGTFVAGSLTTTPAGGDFQCRFPDGPAEPTVQAQVSDPQGADSNIATRAVTVANVAPAISLGGPATAEEGDTKTYTFAVTDPGADDHIVTSACGAHGDNVTGSENYNSSTMEGSFQCRFPDGPATSNVTAGVKDSDDASDSDNQIVSVTVDNVAPVAQDDGYETPEDEPLSVGAPGILGNDTDAGSNDVLGVELAQEPSHGTVDLNPNGSFTYTPNANYNGTDSFTYRANDGTLDSNTAAVTIDVSPVNDAPAISAIADRAIDEDTDTGEIPFNVSDVDNAVGGLTVTGSSSNTTLVPDDEIAFGGSGANRTVKVTPVGGRSGTAEVTVRVSDGSLEAADAFTLTVRDLTAPDTILDSGPSNVTSNKSASFAFSSEAGALFRCRLDGGAFEPCASPENYSGLSEGEHTFRVRAIDTAGNVDPTPISHTWTVDSGAPGGTVSINDGASYTNRTMVSLAVGASDPAPGSGLASMRFSDAAATWSSWESYAASKSWTLDARNGRKTVRVQVKDRAGNVTTMQSTITLDTIAPVLRRVAPRNDARVSADTSVTAVFSEAIDRATLSKSTVKLVRNGTTRPVPATISYDPATKKMTLKPRQTLLSGATYTVTLAGGANGIKDLAGNVMAVSKTWQFSVR